MTNAVHHIELWTSDVEAAQGSFDWLLTSIGLVAVPDPDWPAGRIWQHAGGVYLVLEQSPDVTGPHDRLRAGLNHLALRVADRRQLDDLRVQCVHHGWSELFAERYPHAGGPRHTALFLHNAEGFEVELVADGGASRDGDGEPVGVADSTG